MPHATMPTTVVLRDYLAGVSPVDIALRHDLTLAEVIESIRSRETQQTIDTLRDIVREQSIVYLEQQRVHLLKQLVAIAIRARTLGVDLSTPSGAFVIECMRKACSELLRLANGRAAPHASSNSQKRTTTPVLQPPNPLGSILNSAAQPASPVAERVSNDAPIDRDSGQSVSSSITAQIEEHAPDGDTPPPNSRTRTDAERELDTLLNRMSQVNFDEVDEATAVDLSSQLTSALKRAGMNDVLPFMGPSCATSATAEAEREDCRSP